MNPLLCCTADTSPVPPPSVLLCCHPLPSCAATLCPAQEVRGWQHRREGRGWRHRRADGGSTVRSGSRGRRAEGGGTGGQKVAAQEGGQRVAAQVRCLQH